MDTKKLRQKILDLAIHGKLVPQDPNDEPASVLLERIRAEKERLISEGKIKRSRKTVKTADTHHYEQDVPFEVPKGWVWTTLGEIAESNIGLTYKPSDICNDGVPVYRSNNIQGVKIDTTDIVRVQTTILDKQFLKEGDLLICARNGSRRLVGKNAIIRKLTEKTAFGAFMAVCRSKYNPWLYLLLQTSYFDKYLDESNSTAINQVTQSMLLALNTPLPPLAEQQRIVAEIERWFALIDTIEQGKVELQTAIKQTKSKILDLAIHGKLVPQDPNDEPAIELVRRINPKAQITCDNGHSRKLPQSWTWVKGKNIFAPMKSTKPTNEKFQYIDIDSIDNKRQIISEVKTIKTVNAPSRANRYTQKNDVVFSMVRPYLRNIAKVTNDNCIASTGFYVCSSIPQILHPDYCYYLMISDNVVNGLNQFMKGDNSPSINKGHIDEWLFPLPPLAEQQRIVQKIEKMFFILDDIQNALEV